MKVHGKCPEHILAILKHLESCGIKIAFVTKQNNTIRNYIVVLTTRYGISLAYTTMVFRGEEIIVEWTGKRGTKYFEFNLNDPDLLTKIQNSLNLYR